MLHYVDRHGTNCAKWDHFAPEVNFADTLGMGIADMDFQAPECVLKALRDYVEMGAMGYYATPEGYIDSFIEWEKKYHFYDVKREWVRFSPGVVPAFHWLTQMLVKSGEGVMIQPPVYGPFFSAVKAADAKEVRSPLKYDAGHWEMDLADFEDKIVSENVKLFILCSPHNPVGRVWTKEELKAVLDICRKHSVMVIADEIHQDLVISDRPQYAAAGLGDYSDMLITLTSASKTFNLAALQNSFIVIPDDGLRARYDELQKTLHATGGASFGYIATEAAYKGGRKWLDELIGQVRENYALLKSALEEALPGVTVTELQGTYLAWVDLSAVLKGRTVSEFMGRDCHIVANTGDWFGGEAYKGFTRLNLATSRENVEEAVRRMIRAAQ